MKVIIMSKKRKVTFKLRAIMNADVKKGGHHDKEYCDDSWYVGWKLGLGQI